MVGSGGVCVVGSLAAARLGWDGSRSPQTHTLPPSPPAPPFTSPNTTSSPSGGGSPLTIFAATFRQRSYSWPGLCGTPATSMLISNAGESGASARLRKKKLSGINKQTDRLGEDRKIPLLRPSTLLTTLLDITHSSI